MRILQCQEVSCMARIRVGRFVGHPAPVVGELKYCCVCGGRAIINSSDDDDNYWETLADNHNIPSSILKQIYEVWDRKKFPRFFDFVQNMRSQSTKEMEDD